MIADLIPCHWTGCMKQTREPAPDCSGCGGSGYRRTCDSRDCAEHGCCGGRHCYVSPAEVAAMQANSHGAGVDHG